MRTAAACLLCLALPTLLAAPPPPPQKPLAFTNVTIIDGTGAKPRLDQTVVITGDRITTLGPTRKLKPPAGAQTIDATGRFLIPGLWDMHVHVGSDAKFYLPLFIANGVTGIRIMSGSPFHHQWRQEVLAGAAVGPRMVIGSAIIDGPNSYFPSHVKVASAEEARKAVRKARQEGAEFIKIHDLVPRDAYFALMDEARKHGLPVAGHVPGSLTPEEASKAGQATIEHLTRLDDLNLTGAGRKQAVALFMQFKKNHTWQCPTLVMTRNYSWLDDPAVSSDARVKYVRPGLRNSWQRMTAAGLAVQERAARQQLFRKRQAMLNQMQHLGVGILAGTDLGNPYCFPGSSLSDELALLVEAGLKPIEALQAATRSPARFLGRDEELGTVQTGKRADLVLLDADPLADIRHTTKIQSVITNGRYYDRAALDRMLAVAEATAAVED
jgi:imidazolonepropionase-like amidohydrolase